MAVANSIRTNPSSLTALRTLNEINRNADEIQNRVSTGLKVAGAVDDASNFAIAQGVRTELRAWSAVTQGLRQAQGVLKVAIAAAEGTSDLLIAMKEKTVAARNAGLTTEQRQIIHDDYIELYNQAQDLVERQASFNGFNLVTITSTDYTVLTDIDGGSFTVAAQSINGQSLQFGVAGALDLTSLSNAAIADGIVDTAQGLVANALGSFGADYRRIESQIQFIEEITDASKEGLGNIVDADLARESAKLTSVQIQQQLSVQTLGIANQRPQTLLGLF
ncbi:MAG: hypothetical protein JJ959_08900 [Nisaea sp.]|uniref:flagellin n=1 Tax=Nisaea sp. TaxID=2024842 RepID=UPI001B09C838|nr:flagellin [Nisaea sp.]MBO6560642.1 hypothetical protein [Nisaea sp.]